MSNELVPADAEQYEVLPEPFPLAEEAVCRFLKCGSLAQVGREMHIPVQTLYHASKTAWWLQEVQLRKKMETAAQDAAITEVLDTTIEKLKVMLEEGEDFIDKFGNRYKKGMSGATLARICDVLFDKRQVLRGLPTGEDQTSKKITDLARQLEQFGKAVAAKPLVVDAEDVQVHQPKDGGVSEGA